MVTSGLVIEPNYCKSSKVELKKEADKIKSFDITKTNISFTLYMILISKDYFLLPWAI